ncbi:phosphofructokinase [Guillardia theta CCMP2712]|uniref:Pyrophosphate--fructose 6-phosphate 1-phosphotransferase n=1 Tax=Guillardia theta (strain CCMP2712) TaxID=905079 RepID=L1J3K8_GUITC|nr:phosphofructokinase [Guillardia theta CCMP2712]EKX42675.1 phosphofructokinase [Guillardia theta CCMP2712]|eukprot:XP_005829655.1 phosphofructokinase [Guillardia theta CCMP2712]
MVRSTQFSILLLLLLSATSVCGSLSSNIVPSGEEPLVAILTAGGLAPCLSSAIGFLIEEYTLYDPQIEIICYIDGYKGLLKGEYLVVGPEERKLASILTYHGGSSIGNSRVKLTNIKDCLQRGLVKEGEDPQKVAAEQLVKDGVSVLHTIGGDDTNTAAADLAAFLKRNNYELTVVGLPKTIDNDVYPIRLSLGAWTAAQQGALYFRNIVNEHSANPRMLIVHEVMGRHCGWLTAATAKCYRDDLKAQRMLPGCGLHFERLDVHGIYIPELSIDIAAESKRLKQVMDRLGNVNIFISEGAGVDDIIKQMEEAGQEVPRDAFGHPKLDAVNPGKYFADKFAKELGAEKTMVQKSGYFARSAAPNDQDLALIKDCALKAVECAMLGQGGVIGHDEETPNLELRACEFNRIAGGKPFNVDEGWFKSMLTDIRKKVDLKQ